MPCSCDFKSLNNNTLKYELSKLAMRHFRFKRRRRGRRRGFKRRRKR